MTETVDLTPKQAEALRRVRDRGSSAWCDGMGRAGGAVSRMFDRLRSAGLVSKPPYIVTEQGLRLLDTYDASRQTAEASGTPEGTIEPAVDQIWREADDRFQRYVRILSVRPGRRGVAIRTVVKAGLVWQEAPRSRLSYADHYRFNGKSGGYEFVEALTDTAAAGQP